MAIQRDTFVMVFMFAMAAFLAFAIVATADAGERRNRRGGGGAQTTNVEGSSLNFTGASQTNDYKEAAAGASSGGVCGAGAQGRSWGASVGMVGTICTIQAGVESALKLAEALPHGQQKTAAYEAAIERDSLIGEVLETQYGDPEDQPKWYRNPGARLRGFVGKVPILGSLILRPIF